MIVCCCKAIAHETIAELIASGATSVDDVEQACGAGSACGACRGMIEEMVEEACESLPVACPRRRLPTVPAHAA